MLNDYNVYKILTKLNTEEIVYSKSCDLLEWFANYKFKEAIGHFEFDFKKAYQYILSIA